jgi:hypothetical protein
LYANGDKAERSASLSRYAVRHDIQTWRYGRGSNQSRAAR